MNAHDLIYAIMESAGVYAELSIDDDELKTLQDTQVRVAIQPEYPITCLVKKVTSNDQINEYHGQDGEEYTPTDLDTESVVWLATDQPNSFSKVSPYAPKEAWYDF